MDPVIQVKANPLSNETRKYMEDRGITPKGMEYQYPDYWEAMGQLGDGRLVIVRITADNQWGWFPATPD